MVNNSGNFEEALIERKFTAYPSIPYPRVSLHNNCSRYLVAHSAAVLCVSSDKSTIHIYSLDGQATPNAAQEKVAANRQSRDSLSSPHMQALTHRQPGIHARHSPQLFQLWMELRSFSRTWWPSYVRLWSRKECSCWLGLLFWLITLTQTPVVSSDGSFFKYIFDPVKGGEAQQEGYAVFLKEQKDWWLKFDCCTYLNLYAVPPTEWAGKHQPCKQAPLAKRRRERHLVCTCMFRSVEVPSLGVWGEVMKVLYL